MLMQPSPESFNVSEFIDNARIGRFQIVVAFICGLLFMVDGFDTAIIGTIAPALVKEFAIPRDVLGIVFSAGVAGLFVGYVLIAPLSGRWGNKPVMVCSAIAFGLFSLATVWAEGVASLATLRFCTGIFLGAALPSAVALTGEYSPKRFRATIITYMGLGMSIGLSSAGITTALLLEWRGWRGVMIFAGIMPLLAAVLIIRYLPESIHFQIAKGVKRGRIITIIEKMHGPTLPINCDFRVVTHGSPSCRELFTEDRLAGTLAFWAVLFANLMVYGFLQSWLPTIFLDLGYAPQRALGMTSIAMSGGLVAALFAGPFMDRWGPYKVMCVMFSCGAIALALTGASVHAGIALVLIAAFSAVLFNSGSQKSVGALGVFYYPVSLRSTGLGWGYGVGRIGALLAPVGIGYLMQAHWRTSELFYIAAIPMACGALAMYFMYYRYDRKASISRKRQPGLQSGAAANRVITGVPQKGNIGER
jgi:AAHS family 4-hydroxybenzoate transporter-like MFS transporter